MKRLLFLASIGIIVMALCSLGLAIQNGDFSGGSAFWTPYTSAGSSVSFYPSPLSYVRILAHGSGGYAGIYQDETDFDGGEEWRATFDVSYVSAGLGGIITIGWTDISGGFGSYYKEITSGGTYTVNCDNPAFSFVTVQADSTYILNAIVEVDEITTEEIVTVDTEDPTYGPSVLPGIQSCLRVDFNRAADLTWSEAEDNQTPSNLMQYNVYYAETAGQVFSSPAGVTTFVGVTSGRVSGLDHEKLYYFGVRAEDQSSNEESNSVVLGADLRPAASLWSLYQ